MAEYQPCSFELIDNARYRVLLLMSNYQVGDSVRVVQVPPYLRVENDIVKNEDAAFFERCIGKVFSVQGFDEHRQLELWTTDKGNPRQRSLGTRTHTIWIEPEYVEPVTKHHESDL